MEFGFIKVAAQSVRVHLADPAKNAEAAIEAVQNAKKLGVDLLVFPELSLCGATAGDLILHSALLDASIKALGTLAEGTSDSDMLIFAGLPLRVNNRIYNCVAALCGGKILGIVPKSFIPSHESRIFDAPAAGTVYTQILGNDVPFGTDLIFASSSMDSFRVAVEVGDDCIAAMNPSARHAVFGATLIVNPAADKELVGAANVRSAAVKELSARLVCGYVRASSGYGESTQDHVYAGRRIIAENGKLLSESEPFADGITVTEIDTSFLLARRGEAVGFDADIAMHTVVPFNIKKKATKLTRAYSRTPFIPKGKDSLSERAELILNVQAQGLRRRLEHTNAKGLVLGLSGGLDSTLALIVAAKTLQLCSRPARELIAVTMPCFGTTSRTYNNAVALAHAYGATLREVNIAAAVTQHFTDIGHDPKTTDVTFENSQARERTQVLMDIANQSGALVVGTGDLSELALGWATYNGDHMSMYGVNAGVPKTLIRHLVEYTAYNSSEEIKSVLLDVLDTPVSPELLPAQNGEIAQKTEDLVGPYILHDFFLYHTVRNKFSPKKVFLLARYTFGDEFDADTTYKWLYTFLRRFFAQQFKRSCLPDGVAVGTLGVSPRGGLCMPSDAESRLWLCEMERVKNELL